MKKTLVLSLALLLFVPSFILGQADKNKTGVLYFKADLACCRARGCNMLEADVRKVIEKSFPDGKVVFTTVRIADKANKELVEKHNAKSQTVVLIKKKRKKEQVIDLTGIVNEYSLKRNFEDFEQKLKAKISKNL